MPEGNQPDMVARERLLMALAEQLKSPLLQIAYQAEAENASALADISLTSWQALHLIDSYLLCAEQQELALEPVSVSSVLYDVAQVLDPIARQYGAEIEISVAGKYVPVMANRTGLEAGLVTIGRSLLEADTTAHPKLVLSAFKSQQGIAAGVFGDHPELTADSFRRALALFGGARQPMPTASALNGAGFYVAKALFESMNASLQVVRHHKLTGLSASFVPSAQLRLV